MVDYRSHPNVTTLRAIYRDFSLLADYASRNMVLHAHGSRGIMAGDYFGKHAALCKEMELHRRSGGSLVISADHIVANDHFGVMLGRVAANRDGHEFEGEICGVWRFRDGVIVEHWENCADWPAAERFFLEEFNNEAYPDSTPILSPAE
jgi:ketosteroid isomerase-like protein